MNDRKHCADCDLEYSDEASHKLVHEAVATVRSADPANADVIQAQKQI